MAWERIDEIAAQVLARLDARRGCRRFGLEIHGPTWGNGAGPIGSSHTHYLRAANCNGGEARTCIRAGGGGYTVRRPGL